MQNNILVGQVALVTGGSRGIGREVARALAMAGAKVAVTARNAEKLEETVQIIRDAGGECSAFVMNVTDNTDVVNTVKKVTETYGSIDILVNNAGIGALGETPWNADIDDWWHIQEVNVKGVFLCSRAILPSMVEREQGRIINMGSYASINPSPMSSSYSVSKAALVRLTDSTAEAVKENGVSVFVISPGLVKTDMTKDVPVFQDLPDESWIPIERCGELCVRLASGEADKLTGRFIHASEDDLDDLLSRADEIVENNLQTLGLVK